MKTFDYFIYFTFFIKILLLCSAIFLKYLKYINDKKETPTMVKILYWNERSEFIFKECLSLILIILFNPRNKTQTVLNDETKLLLYLYGIIGIVQADWGYFMDTSPRLKSTARG
jgi:hypothetical protein